MTASATQVASVPLCFCSRRQYELWREAAESTDLAGSDYCTDCTPVYQAEMYAAGRCRYPDTWFDRDADGFVEGRRPIADRVQKAAA